MEWIKTVLVTAAVVAAARAGWRLSGRGGRAWAWGAGAAAVVAAMVTAARRFPGVEFLPPFSWLVAGRLEFVLLGPAFAVILSTLGRRLKSKGQRRLTAALGAVAAAYFSVLPFLLPALTDGSLRRLESEYDSNVCLQSTPYTCGPAAAVTVLGALGIEAREGELAALALTTRVGGTEMDLLCRAIEGRFAEEGVTCEYGVFKSVDELAGTPSLARVRYRPLIDHYVAVLAVDSWSVTIGDPLHGRQMVTREEFERMWRHVAIRMRRAG